MATNRSKVYFDAQETVTQTLGKIAQSAEQTNKVLSKVGSNMGVGHILAVSTAIAAVHKVAEGFFNLFEKAIEIKLETQTAKNGIAGLIDTMYTLRDANGKAFADGPEKFAAAAKVAQDQITKLRVDSIHSGLSIGELTDTYKQGIGPGASMGMTPDQVRQLSVTFSQAGKSLGLGQDQLGKDFKDLLTNSRPTMLSNALGLGHGSPLAEEYKQAIKTGKAYDFLQEHFKAFADAGKAQAESVSGSINAMHDVFNAFANDGLEGFTSALAGSRKSLEELFNVDTGQFKDNVQPIVAMFDTIGQYIGTEIKDGIEWIVEKIQEFGTYLDSDQTLINGFIAGFDEVKNVVASIFGVVGDIFGIFGGWVAAIVNVNQGTVVTNDNLTTMQAVIKVIVAAVSALDVIIAGIGDTIKLVANVVSFVLGSAMAGILDIVTGIIKALANALAFSDKLSDAVDTAAKKMENYNIRLKNSLADSNIINQLKNSNGVGDFFANVYKKTSDAALAGADAIDKASQKTNKTYQDWQAKNKIAHQSQSDGITTTPTNPMKAGGEKKGKGEDTQKLAYENQLKELERQAQQEKDLYQNQQKFLELYYQNNLVDINAYYKQKNDLSEKDYNTQLAYLDKEIAITESQKANAKKMKDGNKLDDKENELLNKKKKLQEEYAFSVVKNNLDQVKAVRQYMDALDELNAKIEQMTSGDGSKDRAVKVRVEIENLQEKYKSNPEELGKISQYAGLLDQQNKISDATEKFNQILKQQSTQEETIGIMQKANNISELAALSQVSNVRKQNIDALKQQIDSLSQVYDATQSPDTKNQIDELKNKLLELQTTVNPLADKFNDIFRTGFTTFFDDILTKNKSLKDSFIDLFTSIEKSVTDLVSKQLSQQLFNSLFGTGSSGNQGIGGFFASLFNTTNGTSGSGTASNATASAGGLLSSFGSWIGSLFHFADGGAVTDISRPILVGEKGPELFYPKATGYIANHKETSSGSGGGGNIYMTVNAKDANSFNQSRGQILTNLSKAQQQNWTRNG